MLASLVLLCPPHRSEDRAAQDVGNLGGQDFVVELVLDPHENIVEPLDGTNLGNLVEGYILLDPSHYVLSEDKVLTRAAREKVEEFLKQFVQQGLVDAAKQLEIGVRSQESNELGFLNGGIRQRKNLEERFIHRGGGSGEPAVLLDVISKLVQISGWVELAPQMVLAERELTLFEARVVKTSRAMVCAKHEVIVRRWLRTVAAPFIFLKKSLQLVKLLLQSEDTRGQLRI